MIEAYCEIDRGTRKGRAFWGHEKRFKLLEQRAIKLMLISMRVKTKRFNWALESVASGRILNGN